MMSTKQSMFVTSMPKHHKALFLVLLAFGLITPFIIYPVFAMTVLCFALFACAFNLLLGGAGLLSFGHAAFFGAACYVSAHATKVWGFSPELAIGAGVLTAFTLGLMIGALAVRSRGIYFAMVTLAFAQMIYFLALKMPFTGGENGIEGVPRRHLLGILDLTSDTVFYYLVLALTFGGIFAIYRIFHSPFGKVMQAIKNNEARAISLGYKVNQYKLIAFVLSATLAGLAGSIKALVFQFASLTDVHWGMSGDVVVMTVVGGIGTIFGPIVGAALLTTMSNYFSGFGSWILIMQGIVFAACILFFRGGIVGLIQTRTGKSL